VLESLIGNYNGRKIPWTPSLEEGKAKIVKHSNSMKKLTGVKLRKCVVCAASDIKKR